LHFQTALVQGNVYQSFGGMERNMILGFRRHRQNPFPPSTMAISASVRLSMMRSIWRSVALICVSSGSEDVRVLPRRFLLVQVQHALHQQHHLVVQGHVGR